MKSTLPIERPSSHRASTGLRTLCVCAVGLFLGLSCASDKSTPTSRSMDITSKGADPLANAPGFNASATAAAGNAGNAPQNGANPTSASAAAASGAGAVATVPAMAPPPPASGCEANALDQRGCACDRPGAIRPCYSADPQTRNVGMCKDGYQTCTSDTQAGVEFAGGKWSVCTEQVVPSECKEQLDARCVGKSGCDDEECATKLGCAKDAGMPDAGRGRCFTVMGWGQGTGFFPDGGMWCER